MMRQTQLLRWMLIRCALLDSKQAIEHYRATGLTVRHAPPLPQRRNVAVYRKAYAHGLSRFS